MKNGLAPVLDEIISCIVGISSDTTGSTPVLLDKFGTPLALLLKFGISNHTIMGAPLKGAILKQILHKLLLMMRI